MGKIGYIEIDDHFAKFRNISYYKLLWFKDYDKTDIRPEYFRDIDKIIHSMNPFHLMVFL